MSPLRALSLLALAASAGAVLVDPLRSLEKPEYFAPGVLSINALLCLFTPGTQPDVTYPGTCESGSAYNNLATTTNEVVTYPYNVPTYTGNQGSNSVTGPTGSNTSTCIFVVNTGNQTNVKGSNNGWYNTTAYGALAHAPVTFPNTSMCAPNNPGIKANAAYLSKYGCYVNATNNNQPTYPYGINPVPPGTKIQGVVYYTSSNTHTWLMDPYYPFASVWVYGSNCIGFNDGIAVGQLLVITIPDDTPANMVISGPTYDGPRAATPTALGGSAVGAMAGLGGGFDQGAYTGVPDNNWVLSLNMQLGVTFSQGSYVVQYAAGTASSPALCPGLFIANAARTWPYSTTPVLASSAGCNNTGVDPTTYVNETVGLNLTSIGVTPSTMHANVPPPPPFLDISSDTNFTNEFGTNAPAELAFDATLYIADNCLSVNEFLCYFTTNSTGVSGIAGLEGGVNYTVTTFTLPNGAIQSIAQPKIPGANMSVCGVFYFGTGTGNAYIQDPFAPFASFWIQGVGVAGKSASLADGAKYKLDIGFDAGYVVGHYLKYTFQFATLTLARAAGAPIYTGASFSSYTNATSGKSITGVTNPVDGTVTKFGNNAFYNVPFSYLTNGAGCDWSQTSFLQPPANTSTYCAISNCELAACNPRHGGDEESDSPCMNPVFCKDGPGSSTPNTATYKAEYVYNVSGCAYDVTVANTAGCGISLITNDILPVVGPGNAENPLLNTGATFCNSTAMINSINSGIVDTFVGTHCYENVMAISNFNSSSFGLTQSKFFASFVLNYTKGEIAKNAASVAGVTVAVNVVGVQNIPDGFYTGRRRLQQIDQFVQVSYTVCVTTSASKGAIAVSDAVFNSLLNFDNLITADLIAYANGKSSTSTSFSSIFTPTQMINVVPPAFVPAGFVPSAYTYPPPASPTPPLAEWTTVLTGQAIALNMPIAYFNAHANYYTEAFVQALADSLGHPANYIFVSAIGTSAAGGVLFTIDIYLPNQVSTEVYAVVSEEANFAGLFDFVGSFNAAGSTLIGNLAAYGLVGCAAYSGNQNSGPLSCMPPVIAATATTAATPLAQWNNEAAAGPVTVALDIDFQRFLQTENQYQLALLKSVQIAMNATSLNACGAACVYGTASYSASNVNAAQINLDQFTVSTLSPSAVTGIRVAMYIATPTAAAAVTALGYFNSLFTNSGNSGSPMVAGGALATALSATGLGSVTAYAYDQSTGTAKAVPTVVG